MLIKSEVWTLAHTEEGNAVLLRPLNSEIAVPIFIGTAEAQSILIGLGRVPMPRPLTHDLFINTFKKLEATIDRIEIIDLKDGTFYASLVLKKGDREIVIDARPSDSIAIAVRKGCPIFIDEKVISTAGISVNLITEKQGPESTIDRESELENLKKELDSALSVENYEKAALIRDRLRELEE